MASQVLPVEIVNLDVDDDEPSLSRWQPRLPNRRSGTTISNAISVDHYSSKEDRDLQFALLSSLNPQKSPSSRPKPIIIDDDGGSDDVQFIDSRYYTPKNRNRKRDKPLGGNSVTEPGESSNSKPKNPNSIFICEICVDEKPQIESFRIKGCTHSYCSDCITKYVASKLQDNITQIPCPVSGCAGKLEPEHCRLILPKEVFDRWGDALCEGLILASEKFYCPYKDCSALLIDDGGDGEVLMKISCPECKRLFCKPCQAPWHQDIECAEFQTLNKDEREKDDIKLMKLAKESKWFRCPKCRVFVERSQGCLFIKCRCGYTFCYNCGTHLVAHYCTKCARTW